MDNATQINACAFFIKDEEGQIREAGIVAFERLRSAIKIEIKVFKEDAREKMVRTCPPGGIAIVDKMTDGLIELVTADMDVSIPYCALTDAIDNLRQHFKVPISPECKAEAAKMRAIIPVKPNPAKS